MLLKKIFATSFITTSFILANVVLPGAAFAQGSGSGGGSGGRGSGSSGGGLFTSSRDEACTAVGTCTGGDQTLTDAIQNVISILSILVGIIAVIMIIYNGFRFITSGGDSGNVSAARNGIIYAIVGLIFAVLAQVIVRFVLDKV